MLDNLNFGYLNISFCIYLLASTTDQIIRKFLILIWKRSIIKKLLLINIVRFYFGILSMVVLKSDKI